jgi:hypothetical protein
MPTYLSDTQSYVQQARAVFLDEKGVPRTDYLTIVEDCYKARDEVMSFAEHPITRKQIISESLDRADRLAIWKTVSSPAEWARFLAELRAEGVSIRDVNEIRKMVEDEFKLILEEAKEMDITSEKVFFFDNVKELITKRTSNGYSVRVEVY